MTSWCAILFLGYVNAMDTSLIQVPEKQYAYANASKQAEYLKTMSKKAIGGYNYKNDDPTMSEYFGLTNEVPSNMVGWNTNVPMKKVDVEVEVPDPADPSKKIKKTVQQDGTVELKKFSLKDLKGGAKFKTKGQISYGWKFNEFSEKKYEKEVKQVNEGNLTQLNNVTDQDFTDSTENVKIDQVVYENTTQKNKVFKGKVASDASFSLLQTKRYQNVTTTMASGFDRRSDSNVTGQKGSVGKGYKNERDLFTIQEGKNQASVSEKPKVTAAKTGKIEVDWMGGDSYTTSKVMHGMKKFLKRASRGDRW